ncbi:unnamed protein product [Diplocarpon coronariae]|nr:hypothetical protein JHW43_002629 [Diplocarpon mali]
MPASIPKMSNQEAVWCVLLILPNALVRKAIVAAKDPREPVSAHAAGHSKRNAERESSSRLDKASLVLITLEVVTTATKGTDKLRHACFGVIKHSTTIPNPEIRASLALLHFTQTRGLVTGSTAVQLFAASFLELAVLLSASLCSPGLFLLQGSLEIASTVEQSSRFEAQTQSHDPRGQAALSDAASWRRGLAAAATAAAVVILIAAAAAAVLVVRVAAAAIAAAAGLSEAGCFVYYKH